MPSPRKTMTFFARPAIAPLAAARAAPLRYHHCAVSPSGWLIGGTSTDTPAGAAARGGVAAQAASRTAERAEAAEAAEAAGSRRGMAYPAGREGVPVAHGRAVPEAGTDAVGRASGNRPLCRRPATG